MSTIKVIKIPLGSKKVKTDLKKLLLAIAKTGVYSFFEKADSAVKESIDIANAFQLKDTPEHKAYQLILTAMVNAAHELIESSRYHLPKPYRHQDKLYDEAEYVKFLDGLTPVLEDSELTIDHTFFDQPCDNPLFTNFKEYFYKALLHFQIEEKDAKPISSRLPLAFTENLHTEWGKNHTQYDIIYNTLNTPFNKALQKQQEWKRYCLHLQRQVEDPVFDEPFGLKDVYMQLRAYYEEKPPKEVNKALPNLKNKKIAVWLDEEMNKWLDADIVQDSIRVISGGPGSGKSSFAKMWAADIAKKGYKKILFIPLHRFRIDANIIDAVGTFVTMPSIPFRHNPLKEKDTELLIIFDGLDELVMQGKTAQQSAIDFIDELRILCNNYNDDKKTNLKILIAGRPISIQNADSKLRRGKDDQILHLLPYFINYTKEYENEDILKEDQRQSWWYKYNVLKEFDNKKIPPELQNKELDKITTEPLLNYLVALSYRSNPEKFGEGINLNQVYENLLEGVFNRDYEKEEARKGRRSKTIENIEFEEFTQILEEITICAWHGGDVRVTSVEKIEKHIEDRDYLQELLIEYKESAKGGVSRLLTAFYFRKHGKDEDNNPTFEFTHKSFGEYLIARAVVQLAEEVNEQIVGTKSKRKGRRKGKNLNLVLEEWVKVTGATAIDFYMLQMIRNEVKLKVENASEVQETFQELLSHALLKGMPMPSNRQSLREENRINRNAEEALLVIADACANVTNKDINIDWENINVIDWLTRLKPPSLTNSVVTRLICRYLNFSEVDLYGVNFIYATLESTDFSFANLRSGIFNAAFMDGANLQGAFMDNAYLLHTNLKNANLERVGLEDAYLRGADLEGANLKGANLERANLRDANLRNVNFEEANLNNVRLEEADLYGINFKGAFLWNTYLEKAILTTAELDNADLSNAHLRNATLTMAKLRNSILVNVDLRDARLDNVDLEGADLFNANLENAIIRSADLRKTNFNSVDLRNVNLKSSSLNEANLMNVDLENANLQSVNLKDANLKGANLKNAKLTYRQLSKVYSLKDCKGLDTKIEEKLRKNHPELFERDNFEAQSKITKSKIKN